MADYELFTDSDLLLEDTHDAADYARNAERLKKVKRQKYAAFVTSTCSLFLIIFLLLHLSSPRHKMPPILKDLPVTHLEPEFHHDYGSKRVQINYGPFTIPGSNVNNGMKNFDIQEIKLPCHGCLITWMQAGLKFIDGSYANAEKGMWLHHTVLLNRGKPATKSCKPSPERFFASGNERTVLDLTLNGTEKTGYWLAEADKVSMTTELMNESKYFQDAFLTVTYEYIPYMPSNFSVVTSVWLDVGNCKSDVAVPKNKNYFELSMLPWTATVNGRILTTISHLHDGGVHLEVVKNGGVVCQSIASYGDPMEPDHHMPGVDMSHISHMSTCYNVGSIQEGDEWTVKAQYDFNKHEPMRDRHGKPEDVMGIAIAYVIEHPKPAASVTQDWDGGQLRN